MPRPKGSRNKQPMTLDAQITAAEERVAKLREELTAAEEALRALTALRDEEQVKALLSAVAEKGISVTEAIAMIKGESEQ